MSDYITKTFTFEGKRYYVRGKTEREALLKLANKQRDLEEGKVAVSGNMTVSAWAYKAVETYKTNQKDITREKYIQRMKKCILDEIGDMPLKQVKPFDCQMVLNKQSGKSKTQINETYQTLKFIFNTARINKLIVNDPSLDIVKPKGYKNTRRALTDEERHHFLKVAETDERFNLFLLMYYCGCRPSEAREVMGKDIDFLNGQPMLHIRGTKTENADRVVPIPTVLYEKIKDTPPDAYVGATSKGKKHDQTTYRRLCKRLYREMNISMGCEVYRNELIPPYPLADDFVPYCLRHTYCTDLQKKGVDIRVAQYLMGHADIQMTANIYTHIDDSTVLDVAEKLNKKCNS